MPSEILTFISCDRDTSKYEGPIRYTPRLGKTVSDGVSVVSGDWTVAVDHLYYGDQELLDLGQGIKYNALVATGEQVHLYLITH